MSAKDRYFVTTEKVANRPGTWDSLRVTIHRRNGEATEKIGEYVRNYPNLYQTFYPFTVAGRDYALYSRDYTATRVMRLPECEDIGGEERDSFGFCPVEFYVPTVENGALHLMSDKYLNDESIRKKDGSTYGEHWRKLNAQTIAISGKHGFVAGCMWGDDSSWKIQYLDLSEVEKGIIRRDERFGYLELPEGLSLDKAVDYSYEGDGWTILSIAVQVHFHLDESARVTAVFPPDLPEVATRADAAD